jgi:beta-phosphoglucomutase-like phosphatase (HAD superfamily)
MIDMDGTITDTEILHYNGYKYALELYGIYLDFNEYINLSNNGKVDEYLHFSKL